MTLNFDRTHFSHAVSVQIQDWQDCTPWRLNSTAFLPWRPKVHVNEWDEQALAPYMPYTKLYEERELARHPIRPFRLLDLPPEIRNVVYRHVLVLEDAIELAPLHWNRPQKHRLVMRAIKRYRLDIIPRLGLLRTCKKVYDEASSIFYGGNEFRFSNSQGWFVLSAFLQTIGERSQRLLRLLTVHPLWHSQRANATENKRFPASQLQDMGLKYLPRERRRQLVHSNQFACVLHCKMLLESFASLSRLKLAVPENILVNVRDRRYPFRLPRNYGVIDVTGVLDQTQFPKGLQVSLIRLRRYLSKDVSYPDWCIRSVQNKRLQTYRDEWAELARERGWNVEVVAYDDFGRYPLTLSDEEKAMNVCGNEYDEELSLQLASMS